MGVLESPGFFFSERVGTLINADCCIVVHFVVVVA